MAPVPGVTVITVIDVAAYGPPWPSLSLDRRDRSAATIAAIAVTAVTDCTAVTVDIMIVAPIGHGLQERAPRTAHAAAVLVFHDDER